ELLSHVDPVPRRVVGDAGSFGAQVLSAEGAKQSAGRVVFLEVPNLRGEEVAASARLIGVNVARIGIERSFGVFARTSPRELDRRAGSRHVGVAAGVEVDLRRVFDGNGAARRPWQCGRAFELDGG